MISAQLTTRIRRLLDAYVAQERDDPSVIDLKRIAAQLDALPVLMDMGGCIAIRPDGELIGFLWDEPEQARPERDPHFRFLALYEASQRYPELMELAPSRTAEDRDCEACGGTGEVSLPEELRGKITNIRCYCGGAGWLPRSVPPFPRH
jgi:hypothetical protein